MKLVTLFESLCILLIASAVSFAQAAAVKIEVIIPSDTSHNKTDVFLAGSFNGWNAHDSLYLMKSTGDKKYSLEIPVFAGKKYLYKYTQGDWASVETALEGSDIQNRIFLAQNGLVLKDTVLKWKAKAPEIKKDSALVLSSKQVEELTRMKEDMEKKIAERTKSAGDLLRQASLNMLSDKPDMEMRKKFHDEIMSTVDFALELASEAMWKVASILTPEQKKAIQQEFSKPNGPGDIFGAISNALVIPKK